MNSLEEFGITDYTIKSSSLKNIFIKINKNKELKEEKLVFKTEKRIFNFYQKLKQQYSLLKFLIFKDLDIILIILELISVLLITYIFICYCTNIIINYENKDLNLIKLLEKHPIYIYENKNNYLKTSYVYSLSNSIKFIYIKEEPDNISNFINSVYINSFANIAKGSISIKNVNNILEAYNTYIYSEYNGYLFANTMMIVSAFLKNEYNIDASIFSDIK